MDRSSESFTEKVFEVKIGYEIYGNGYWNFGINRILEYNGNNGRNSGICGMYGILKENTRTDGTLGNEN